MYFQPQPNRNAYDCTSASLHSAISDVLKSQRFDISSSGKNVTLTVHQNPSSKVRIKLARILGQVGFKSVKIITANSASHKRKLRNQKNEGRDCTLTRNIEEKSYRTFSDWKARILNELPSSVKIAAIDLRRVKGTDSDCILVQGHCPEKDYPQLLAVLRDFSETEPIRAVPLITLKPKQKSDVLRKLLSLGEGENIGKKHLHEIDSHLSLHSLSEPSLSSGQFLDLTNRRMITIDSPAAALREDGIIEGDGCIYICQPIRKTIHIEGGNEEFARYYDVGRVVPSYVIRIRQGHGSPEVGEPQLAFVKNSESFTFKSESLLDDNLFRKFNEITAGKPSSAEFSVFTSTKLFATSITKFFYRKNAPFYYVEPSNERDQHNRFSATDTNLNELTNANDINCWVRNYLGIHPIKMALPFKQLVIDDARAGIKSMRGIALGVNNDSLLTLLSDPEHGNRIVRDKMCGLKEANDLVFCSEELSTIQSQEYETDKAMKVLEHVRKSLELPFVQVENAHKVSDAKYLAQLLDPDSGTVLGTYMFHELPNTPTIKVVGYNIDGDFLLFK